MAGYRPLHQLRQCCSQEKCIKLRQSCAYCLVTLANKLGPLAIYMYYMAIHCAIHWAILLWARYPHFPANLLYSHHLN